MESTDVPSSTNWEGGYGGRGGSARLFLHKETWDRNYFRPRGDEGRCSKPRPKLLVFEFKAAFTLNPRLAISIIMRETSTPIAEVREAFIFEEDLVNLTIF